MVETSLDTNCCIERRAIYPTERQDREGVSSLVGGGECEELFGRVLQWHCHEPAAHVECAVENAAVKSVQVCVNGTLEHQQLLALFVEWSQVQAEPFQRGVFLGHRDEGRIPLTFAWFHNSLLDPQS